MGFFSSLFLLRMRSGSAQYERTQDRNGKNVPIKKKKKIQPTGPRRTNKIVRHQDGLAGCFVSSCLTVLPTTLTQTQRKNVFERQENLPEARSS
jgi:hypothetical protein